MKNTIKNIMFFALSLLIISIAYAAITINTPAASGTVTGASYVFNVTVLNADDIVNCTWSLPSDTNFSTTLNTSADQLEFTNTTDTTGFTDAASVTQTVYCISTGSVVITSTRTVNVDNTDPVCSYQSRDAIDFMAPLGLEVTQLSTDLTTLTYAWVLYDPNGASKATATTGDPDFKESHFDELGDYILALTVTDAASKTNACTNKSITVVSDNAADTISIISGIGADEQSNRATLFIVLGVIFIIIIGAVLAVATLKFAKKKKK